LALVGRGPQEEPQEWAPTAVTLFFLLLLPPEGVAERIKELQEIVVAVAVGMVGLHLPPVGQGQRGRAITVVMVQLVAVLALEGEGQEVSVGIPAPALTGAGLA
jgi:hypothetical protein